MGFELAPQDFLHALYQKLLPFLEQDSVLKSILRSKTAEVLVSAPARLLTRQLGDPAPSRNLAEVPSDEEQ